jgi:hypothetical protein
MSDRQTPPAETTVDSFAPPGPYWGVDGAWGEDLLYEGVLHEWGGPVPDAPSNPRVISDGEPSQ